MITLTADDTTLLKDVGLFIEPIEVYDSAGKLLGLFVPANLEHCKARQAEILAQIDWDEIERRRQAKEPPVPFKDTLARLKQLEAEANRRKATGEKAFTPEEGLAYFRSLPKEVSTGTTSSAGGAGETP